MYHELCFFEAWSIFIICSRKGINLDSNERRRSTFCENNNKTSKLLKADWMAASQSWPNFSHFLFIYWDLAKNHTFWKVLNLASTLRWYIFIKTKDFWVLFDFFIKGRASPFIWIQNQLHLIKIDEIRPCLKKTTIRDTPCS